MHYSDNSLLFSATDLCNHLECPHLTSLARIDLDTPLEKDNPDEESELIKAKGLEHEKLYLAKLQSEGKSVLDLGTVSRIYDECLEESRKAMASGAEIIYQALLFDKPFMGYADFLVRVERPSNLGNFSYEVLDTKLALHTKPYYIIQLCLYSEMLHQLQGSYPECIHVTLGDVRTESFRLQDYLHYFSQLKNEFLSHLENGHDTYPDPCANCDRCQFRSLCEERRIEDDHLSQVANIRKGQIQRLMAVNITTMADLARCEHNHVAGIGDPTLERLKQQAFLQDQKRSTGKDKFVLLQPKSATKGLQMLPPADEGDLFFDIEGDPLFPDGLEYLFGVFYRQDGKERFLDLWSHSHREERSAFEKLIEFFIKRLNKYPNMHIYHYASYEETAIKRLMSKYGTMEAEVDHLLRQMVLVDLYKIVRFSIQVSEPSYSIKNLERFYMKDREADVKSAGTSIVYYEKYRSLGDQKFLDDIRAYNLDDCRSLYLLQGWFGELKNDAKLMMPEESPERESFGDREDPHLEQLKEFEKALIQDLPNKESDYSDDQRLDKLIYDLADFYRREAKPAWWRMFSRQTMTTEELVEDSECIGQLQAVADSPPYTEKRSTVYTYSFPEQEFKFKEGDSALIAETLENAGSIVHLGYEECIIKLKRGTAKGALPQILDIVPKGPIGTDPLKEALWLYIKAHIEAKSSDGKPYPAITDVLSRRAPRIQDIEPGSPLYQTPASISDYLSIAERLQDSYLFIQGPPGAGKTYTASHLILGLIKAGKKVGVTANSHKVIHNLLRVIETRADEEHFSFEGIKKSSWSSDETIYEGKYIENGGTNDDVFAAFNRVSLIAGTAWLFSSLGGSQVLDYIVVDEAGQMSLANLVAVGTSAKNIILVGDQMQLAQPTQGIHPGDSGQSVLDYLLQGRHTIPIEEGILLETTYRMHPKVCEFISDAIYDGRIRSLPGLEKQELQIEDMKTNGILRAGITCHYVDSQSAVQRSDEEAQHVKALYDTLLTLEYSDRHGSKSKMSPENILIVSPYNMQVNNLKRVLGPEARVGTVDKFQGQEAEVVIVSMATSSPENVPRGLDFLYSQNRLNVAISRARCLSILVASPKLFSARAATIEQMSLVNTLCWLKEYSLREDT